MNEFKGWKIYDFECNSLFPLFKGRGIYSSDHEIALVMGKTSEEALYNAKLISMAPEMLEMLIKMKGAMSELTCLQDGWENDYVELEELIKEATTI